MSGHLLRSSLPIVTNLPFSNTAGLAGRQAIGLLVLDVNEEHGVHKRGRVLRRKQNDASANLRTGPNGRGKTDLVQTVVDGHGDARTDLDRLFKKVAQQRKRQKTVGNAAAKGRFALRALGVEVNPLPVLGGLGEFSECDPA